MRSLTIIELEVTADTGLGFADRCICVQIHLFVFNASPKAFYEYVITPATFAVHADPYFTVSEGFDELMAGKLAALIRIEYLW